MNRSHPLGSAKYLTLALAPMIALVGACAVSGEAGDNPGAAPSNGVGGSLAVAVASFRVGAGKAATAGPSA